MTYARPEALHSIVLTGILSFLLRLSACRDHIAIAGQFTVFHSPRSFPAIEFTTRSGSNRASPMPWREHLRLVEKGIDFAQCFIYNIDRVLLCGRWSDGEKLEW